MEYSNEHVNEEDSLAEISHLLDKVLILVRQSVNTCTYSRRFNILITFVTRKKVKPMIKDNFQTFIHKLNLSMLYIAQNTKKMQLNCYHQNENLRNCLGH